ncbi:MAG: NAD(P)/FAD-dependent oxidoreductase [Rhizobiales bacterium]|nr:NAD(P)/FAD-dependent oxidoreductase [Hyphomicrobiales bacterium]
MDSVDCIVVGAGVVGLTVARALALQGREVIVLESAEGIGTGTSSRNSEVIHAGIYYKAGSLKARLCIAGRKALYAYCVEHGVAANRCGKLIVATSEAENGQLASIRARAEANGVDDMREISGAQARAMEPALAVTGALLSPSTGVVDSHGYMLALQGDCEAAGGMVAFHAPVTGGRIEADGIVIETGGAEPMALKCRLLVNAAGLAATDVIASVAGFPAAAIPPVRYAKGNYFTLAGRAPFSHLIYPVPVPGGLGVHLTLDLGGQAKFGPDVEWVERIAYEVDPKRGEQFYDAIRRYWPGLADGTLQPGYSGIRPKVLGADGKPTDDFTISGPKDHGIGGVINLFGIESPGLTASLAIAGLVAGMAVDR